MAAALGIVGAAVARPVAGLASKPPRGSAPPSVTITSPAVGATVGGSVLVTGSASDPSHPLTSVQVSVDGSAFQPATGTASWSWTLSTTAYTTGGHTITARAADSAGNAAVASITVTFDNTAPAVSITAPVAGGTLAGTVAVSGSASDDTSVREVDVAVDQGPWAVATGTTAWSWSWSTATAASGSHTLRARAIDAAGMTAATSESVSVDNGIPAVVISTPSGGASVSGTVSVTGSASDPGGVSSVRLSVDGGAYQAATGTSSWSWSWSTAALADGSHTLSVVATNAAGTSGSASLTVTTSNAAPAPGPPAPLAQQTYADGSTIQIYTTYGGWTPDAIHAMLVADGLDGTVGPSLTVKVQQQYADADATAAVQTGGVYVSVQSVIYLQATASSVFSMEPNASVGHEFGHAWTLYYLYMVHNGDWTAYYTYRGLTGNPSLNTSYVWTDREIIADDYRLVLGSALAVSENPNHLNPYLPQPSTYPGFATWFLTVWR